MLAYHEFRAMNTDILLAAEDGSPSLAGAFRQVQAYIEESEARFSRFLVNSELARLNRSAGSWFQASDDLYEMMYQAYEYHFETGGLFNPAILEVLKYAGYDQSMEAIKSHGASLPAAQQVKPHVPDFSQVQLDEITHQIRLPQGMQVDLGGIAKGWVSEYAAHILAEYTPACTVSAGGDMFMVGLPTGTTAWEVSLEDPRDPNATLAILNVGPGAVATSSVTKRRWMQGERDRHHLIDPRTGEPAVTRWLSVTVITPHATTAEVFAKTLLITGKQAVEIPLAYASDLAFIAVDESGAIWGNDNSQAYVEAMDSTQVSLISTQIRSI
jgi:thiamine biosynthesis lipoprotein